MTTRPPEPPGPARIAELQAAIRYWESEAKAGGERAEAAKAPLAECRARLAALGGYGVGEAGC